MVKGIAQPTVNLRDLREFPIPVPSRDEQDEIVNRVHALFALTGEIEQRVKSATTRADGLTQAILAKAFNGDLVPTEAELARREGRDYEPASVLLERIQAERTTQTPGNGQLRMSRNGRRPRQASA